ncbi:MAG: bifunctional nuclease family protein [Nitrospinota bacterium]|nr:bifunctional nuclease family protein [Nitrospinota bacterium]
MENGSRIEMRVEGLTLDPVTNMPILILKDLEGNRSLPIWIGVFEANAIALEMEKVSPPRPMTHDLIKNIFDAAVANVDYICVNELKDNTFFAIISVKLGKMNLEIDSRPSDAIAVALRMNAKILVEKKVLEEAKSFDTSQDASLGEDQQWKKWLNEVKPEDFGNIDQ